MPLILQKIWGWHHTRHEGGGATHVTLAGEGRPLCGFYMRVGGQGEEFDAATELMANVTDCGRCARGVARRLREAQRRRGQKA